MKNRLKQALTFLFYFLFLQIVFGQEKSDMTNFLRDRFTSYCTKVPREEIFVHTDRDEYISGEEMWFSTFLFERQGNRPSLKSTIAYFEILNSDNRPVIQRRIRLSGGFGSGQAILPDTLSSGSYMIRVYTNYMKNFLPDNCFMKEIKVFNAFNTSNTFNVRHSEVSLAIADSGGGNTESNRRFGVSGISFKIAEQSPELLELNVSSDDRFRFDNNNICYLFIQTSGNIDHISKERLSAGNSVITVPKSVLSAGINQLTLFDSKGRPVAERYFYSPRKSSSFPVKMTDSCNVRSRVLLEIDMTGGALAGQDASNFSISVVPVQNSESTADMSDYLVFGSEFGVFPADIPGGGRLSDIAPEMMENLLNGIKSNWIDWTSIVTGDVPELNYKAESDSHFLSGRLIMRNRQSSDSGKYIFMSSPGKAAVFQYAKTDRDGNFTLSIADDGRPKDLIIQAAGGDINSTVRIGLSFSETYPVFSSNATSSPDIGARSHFSRLSVNYQVNRIYGITSLGGQLAPPTAPVKKLRFYGKPDAELIMADYIKLPVMQEVFFELLPGAQMKSKRSVYEITIADPVTNKVYEDAPGLMIDGVIVNDPAMIANIDPEIVERIDLVRDKYYVGDYMFYGLVNVITKAGDFSCVQLPGYAVRIPYRVTEPEWSFVSPDYSTEEKKNSKIPDFRNTLYWNPSVRPGSDGIVKAEFWSSDVAGEYVVDIQGIGSDSNPVSVRKIISVK
jgi:hypothetical protein